MTVIVVIAGFPLSRRPREMVIINLYSVDPWVIEENHISSKINVFSHARLGVVRHSHGGYGFVYETLLAGKRDVH